MVSTGLEFCAPMANDNRRQDRTALLRAARLMKFPQDGERSANNLHFALYSVCRVGEYLNLRPSKTSQTRSSASILAQGFARSSMFYTVFPGSFTPFRRCAGAILLLPFVLGMLLEGTIPLAAQNQPGSAPAANGQQEPPPAAGGPQSDVGPYAIPNKKEEPPPPPPPAKPKKIEGMPDYSIRVDVPLVQVPVAVTTKDGQFISNLKKENFRVFEDGTAQTISNFTISEAPITAVLVVEFASTNYSFIIDALNASYSFANTLKKDDWVAVIAYDMKPQIMVDFTQDKKAVYGALNQLRMPGFSETNLFDALYDSLDRIDRIEGHKYIVLISTGFDSFSKLNLDQITKKVK